MWGRRNTVRDTPPGKTTFLVALSRDVRGNTLAIMAMALIPLAGMVGGGIDISRMYLTKTRLQHACDAGALAGRKQMGAGVWNATSLNSANQFFVANYQSGAYGSTDLAYQFTQNAGKVTGTASVNLPMTLTRVIGADTQALAVTCETDMRLPNTDVMFVLDTTGSMGSPAVATDTDTKIVSLRKAVKCFYEIVARLDTDATCTTGTPSGGTGSQVQIRFGFMPYSTNVNVGKLLPTSYFADSWAYQSRSPNYTTTTNNTYPNPPVDSTGPSGSTSGTPTAWADTGSNSCTAPATTTSSPTTTTSDSTPVTAADGTITYTTTTTIGTVKTEYRKVSVFIILCKIEFRTTTTGTYTSVVHTQTPVKTTTQTFKDWKYGAVPQTVSGLKNGTSWNNAFTLPLGASGANRLITWDGCIEERKTNDLDIDAVPTAGDANSVWAPALPDLIYARNALGGLTTSTAALLTRAESPNSTAEYNNSIPYYCPTEAKKLQPWPDAVAFDNYVDSLTPSGNTYHDIGMVWGARFISPDGIFAAENRLTPSGGTIQRNIIFMTDGDAQASACDYAAHGVPWFDQRSPGVDVGTNATCPLSNTALADDINTRLVTLCTAVKNKNITLWVISFGSGSNTATETRLSNCATPGRYFAARDSATLQQTFANIANQISQLRLTR